MTHQELPGPAGHPMKDGATKAGIKLIELVLHGMGVA